MMYEPNRLATMNLVTAYEKLIPNVTSTLNIKRENKSKNQISFEKIKE